MDIRVDMWNWTRKARECEMGRKKPVNVKLGEKDP